MRLLNKINIKYSPVNPYLINPVKALYNGQDVGISHAFETNKGLQVGLETTNGYSMVDASLVTILNHHELSRFESLCEMLKIDVNKYL